MTSKRFEWTHLRPVLSGVTPENSIRPSAGYFIGHSLSNRCSDDWPISDNFRGSAGPHEAEKAERIRKKYGLSEEVPNRMKENLTVR